MPGPILAQRDLPSGKTRRVTVGAVNEITLDKARERAADMLDSLRRGPRPQGQERDRHDIEGHAGGLSGGA